MKKLIFLFLLLLPLFVNGQKGKVNTVDFTAPFDEGITTRTLNFYIINGDTLVESLYVINYFDEDKLDEVNKSQKVPYRFFVESDKASIIRFVERKLHYMLKSEYIYEYKITFPDLWRKSAMHSTVDLKIKAGEKEYDFNFGILIDPLVLQNEIKNRIK